MRFDGVIRSWNDERGFGFIEPTAGGQEIFAHIKAFPRGEARPAIGQRVSFEVEPGPQGRKRACKIAVVRPSRLRASAWNRSPARRGGATLLLIPVFMVLYVAADFLWKPPGWIGALYLAASAVTFLAYWMDKSAAKTGEWRTPESTLHALAVIGGWPGAMLAQQWLRHKSVKADFRRIFWGTVIVNVAVLVVLASPMGRALRVGL